MFLYVILKRILVIFDVQLVRATNSNITDDYIWYFMIKKF